MASQYDPALCERLCREAREDDARMTRAPWFCFESTRSETNGWPIAEIRRASPNGGPAEMVRTYQCTPCDECGGDHVNGADRWNIADIAVPRSRHYGCGRKALSDACDEARFDGRGIARTRNNLSAMADQLEAATRALRDTEDALAVVRQASIERGQECDALRAEVARLTDRTRGQEWQEDVSAVVVTLRREVDHWRDARNAAMAAGEILKAEADKLRAGVERMRPVVDAAEYYVDAGGAAEVSDAACDLQAAVHDYRANEKP